MKVTIFRQHGPIENLEIAALPTPSPSPGEVLDTSEEYSWSRQNS